MLQDVAVLLPPSLKRLSWDPVQYTLRYDLSHLTQLTFLQLADWPWEHLSSRELPPCLQQLEVMDLDNDNLAVLEEQREVVTAWDIEDLEERRAQRLLARLPNLTGARVTAWDLSGRGALAAVQQLCKLSALTLSSATDFVAMLNVQAVVAAAASMSSVQCLYLQSFDLTERPALTVLTQLTQLRVSAWRPVHCTEEQQAAWAEVLQTMAGLRWLSVPGVLLQASQRGLGGMERLQVLMLHVTVSTTSTTTTSSSDSMPWLEGCTREVLPPSLQLLGVSGMSAQQAAAWHLRRRLQQRV
jgi:hypothetical protein